MKRFTISAWLNLSFYFKDLPTCRNRSILTGREKPQIHTNMCFNLLDYYGRREICDTPYYRYLLTRIKTPFEVKTGRLL